MKYCIILISIILSVFSKVSAQTNNNKKHYLDSLSNLLSKDEKDSLKLLNSKHTFEISLTGNNQELTKSSIINNKATTYKLLVFNPQISYTLKNGLGISYENIFFSNNNKFTILQHLVSLKYDNTKNENFNFGLNFNKYFTKDSSEYDATKFDYGFGANFVYLKNFIQPYIYVSYDYGSFNEKYLKKIYNATINSFITTFGVQHSYDWENVNNKKWDINFNPKLMLNAGMQKYYTNIPAKRVKLIQKLATNNYFISRNISDKFSLISASSELSASFTKGIFSISPTLFFDYGFNTNEGDKKLATIASLALGITF